ncbi:hypothetical protein [Mycolicibacterium conceptionense]|nr:hypothetical protein [Mycolicibacterium conceptionense]
MSTLDEQKRAAAIVRAWILITGCAMVPVDPGRRIGMPASSEVDSAIASLPPELRRTRPEGEDVILADLNHFLGRETWDRNGDDGVEYPPHAR